MSLFFAHNTTYRHSENYTSRKKRESNSQGCYTRLFSKQLRLTSLRRSSNVAVAGLLENQTFRSTPLSKRVQCLTDSATKDRGDIGSSSLEDHLELAVTGATPV